MSLLASLVAGVLFGIGLAVAGMTDPANVRGFLDLFGEWRPALALVMGGAIAVHLALWRVMMRRGTPLFDTRFHLPTRRDIDGRLVAGAAIFGIGWGLGGYCPGPGIVSLGTAGSAALTFVGAMVAGMLLQHGVDAVWGRRRAAAEACLTPGEPTFSQHPAAGQSPQAVGE